MYYILGIFFFFLFSFISDDNIVLTTKSDKVEITQLNGFYTNSRGSQTYLEERPKNNCKIIVVNIHHSVKVDILVKL